MEGRTVREAPRARARKLVAHNPVVTGAAFHKGESKQDYATPREFIRAVELKFGKIEILRYDCPDLSTPHNGDQANQDLSSLSWKGGDRVPAACH